MAQLRSWLFVPGNREDLLAKAPRFAPDALILDLEDAVPEDPEHVEDGVETPKQAARRIIAALTAEPQGRPIWVRPRAAHLPASREDILAVAGPGLAGIVLPQANAPADVLAADAAIADAEREKGLPAGSIKLIAMPENALGIVNAYATFTASPRMVGAVFASAEGGDLTQALGFRSPLAGDELLYARSKVQLEARAAGLEFVIDGVFPKLDAADAFLEDSRKGWRQGFTGRMAVNPIQVAVLNELYAPSESEIERAKGQLAAMEAAVARGEGSARYRGELVDVATIRSARATLAAAGLLDASP